MNKIKIIQHSKYLGFSGTDKTAQLFYKYLNQSDKFECYLLYRKDHDDCRRKIVESWHGKDKVIPYEWVPGKSGKHSPYMPEHDNLFDVIQSIDPQIVHYHFAGLNEWPVFKYLSPSAKIVTTNIFGYSDVTQQSNLTIYICDYIRNRALKAGSPDGPILYNPIEQPPFDMTLENKTRCKEFLLDKFKLPRNSILLGKIGRQDNFDPISLKAFQEMELQIPNAYYIVVNPCQNWYEWTNKLNIKNIRFSDPIIDDNDLWTWYLGLDIYAHARYDGDCCPVSIQQAMMAGVPVISHESAIYNGQSEIIGDAGFVVPLGDHLSYSKILVELARNGDIIDEDTGQIVRMRDHFGRLARRRAMRHFEAGHITSKLEKIYDFVLKQ